MYDTRLAWLSPRPGCATATWRSRLPRTVAVYDNDGQILQKIGTDLKAYVRP